MAETAYIGIVRDDNSVDSINCERDGYLGGAGMMLTLNYNTKEEAEALILLGDLVAVGYNLQNCKTHEHAYIQHSDNFNDFFDLARSNEIKSCYLFREGEWRATQLMRDDITYPPMESLEKLIYYYTLGMKRLSDEVKDMFGF